MNREAKFLKELEGVLEIERQILLSGQLRSLEGVIDLKEKLVAEHKGEVSSLNDIETAKKISTLNQEISELLSVTKSSLKKVSIEISEILSNSKGFKFYGPDNQTSRIQEFTSINKSI